MPNNSKFLIIGANGQLGKALNAKYPEARAVDMDVLDISDEAAVTAFDWSGVDIVLNAAAYTNVDGAETAEGRVAAWQANSIAAANLAKVCAKYNITLVHISTDYVFDGTKDSHSETEAFSPLNVYGASKTAGDIAIATHDKHYILRTSWVIGDGKNFVRTMLELGQRGINPSVVNDQVGRLTFTNQLVGAVNHLLVNKAPFGTYNMSNEGKPASWADITRAIYNEAGLDNSVTDVSTLHYYSDKVGIAPRPAKSTLDLAKIKATGFEPKNWRESLKEYIKKELNK